MSFILVFIWEFQHALFTPKVLWVRDCTSILSYVVFIFEFALNLSKSLGCVNLWNILAPNYTHHLLLLVFVVWYVCEFNLKNSSYFRTFIPFIFVWIRNALWVFIPLQNLGLTRFLTPNNIQNKPKGMPLSKIVKKKWKFFISLCILQYQNL